MLRLTAIALLVGIAVFVVPAAATMLGGDSGRLLADGHARVRECDDALTVRYETSGGEVTAVEVGGIADPACSGGRLFVTLTAGGDGVASGGPVEVPPDADGDDDTVTVPVSGGARASAVDRADVLIEAAP